MTDSASPGEQHLTQVPCLEEMLDRMIAVVPFPQEQAFRFLDLGGGSGTLSERLLSHFKESHCTLIEASETLCAEADARLSAFGKRLEIQQENFAFIDLPRGFDLVVSLMQFHEMGDIERRGLYRTAYSILVPGGMVVIADEVRGASGGVESLYQSTWRSDARRKGILEDELAGDSVSGGQIKGMLLGNEMPWMGHVGFRDVDTYYKNFRFAVYGGRRPIALDFAFGAGSETDEGRPPE